MKLSNAMHSVYECVDQSTDSKKRANVNEKIQM